MADGFSQISAQYIDIDVESDDVFEEVKNDGKLKDEEKDIDLLSLPTQILFKKAGKILNIIQDRLKDKEALIRERLTQKLREP